MLTELPVEVLVLIFQQFSIPPRSRSIRDSRRLVHSRRLEWGNLARLSQTCRHFQSIAKPLLYQNYYKPDTVLDHFEQQSFQTFLCTLLKRPELARCVRSLHIGPWWYEGSLELDLCYDYSREDLIDTEPSAELVSLYLAHLAKTDATDIRRGEWIQALESGEEEAAIALLLTLTTNVRHIDLAMPNFKPLQHIEKPLIFPQLLTPSSARRFFSQLASLSAYRSIIDMDKYPFCKWDIYPEYLGYPLSPILPFLNVPSLVDLEIQGSFERRLCACEYYPDYDAYSSNLRHISLSQCAFSPEMMKHLISRCVNLESLVGVFVEDALGSVGFSWNYTNSVLGSQRHVLKRLEFTSKDDDKSSAWAADNELFTDDLDHDSASIGSLQMYTALTDLNTSQDALLGDEKANLDSTMPATPLHQILLANVQSLVLRRCTPYVIPQFEKLLLKLPAAFSHPKSICIKFLTLTLNHEGAGEKDKGLMNRLDRLRDGFKKIGVHWQVDKPMRADSGDVLEHTSQGSSDEEDAGSEH